MKYKMRYCNRCYVNFTLKWSLGNLTSKELMYVVVKMWYAILCKIFQNNIVLWKCIRLKWKEEYLSIFFNNAWYTTRFSTRAESHQTMRIGKNRGNWVSEDIIWYLKCFLRAACNAVFLVSIIFTGRFLVSIFAPRPRLGYRSLSTSQNWKIETKQKIWSCTQSHYLFIHRLLGR